ncbi:MAG: DUF2088 domain-containing protein [Anaerolineales bacterium]|nr:DUF2088 domain-containing protein [Anaerolineales bacterium]
MHLLGELGALQGATVITAAPVEPTTNVAATIDRALEHPVGTPALATLAATAKRVAIIVDDGTRKTPVNRILPPLLAALDAGGVPADAVQIVVALGTHRPLTPAELAYKIGAEVVARYPVINVSCTDADAFVQVGEDDEIPAFVLRDVLEADLRIGVGMITPHLDAGFSGGAKIILPGVCALATVDAFHRASAFVAGNQLGRVAAPLRVRLEAFVARHAPLALIVNAVLTPEGALYGCVAGDPILAHRAGVELARAVYGVRLSQRYPVVVADAAPYDQDLWQSIKGAWAGDLATADGGTLILVTAAPEGNSNYPDVPRYAGMAPDLVRQRLLDGTIQDSLQAATGSSGVSCSDGSDWCWFRPPWERRPLTQWERVMRLH